MSDDELIEGLDELWNQQEDDMHIANAPGLMDSVRQLHQREQRRLIWINIRETSTALALAGLFGWMGLTDGGDLFLVLAAGLCLFVGLYLSVSSLRQQRIEGRFDHSVRGELERTLSQLRHRARLYRTLLWWYFLPLFGVLVLIMFGPTLRDGQPIPIELGLFLLLAVVLYAALYAYNRRVGTKRYDPEIERHQRLLDQLDQSDRPDRLE